MEKLLTRKREEKVFCLLSVPRKFESEEEEKLLREKTADETGKEGGGKSTVYDRTKGFFSSLFLSRQPIARRMLKEFRFLLRRRIDEGAGGMPTGGEKGF